LHEGLNPASAKVMNNPLALTPVGERLLREDVHYEKSADGVHA